MGWARRRPAPRKIVRGTQVPEVAEVAEGVVLGVSRTNVVVVVVDERCAERMPTRTCAISSTPVGLGGATPRFAHAVAAGLTSIEAKPSLAVRASMDEASVASSIRREDRSLFVKCPVKKLTCSSKLFDNLIRMPAERRIWKNSLII